ncbi:MAG: dihydrofolate reductase family protein [Saprospiraceae bacterium]
MRKLKLQVQMTMDGFISGINGEMDWMSLNWSEDINDYVREITLPVDLILLGRVLAEGFIPHWTASFNSSEPEEGSEIFVTTPKVVFTNTMKESIWENTVLAKNKLEDEINDLKNQAGGDIIAYGGSKFVSSLIKHNLIDEYHLFINPAAIGSGLPIFHNIEKTQSFTLKSSKHFDCGIIVLCYVPK